MPSFPRQRKMEILYKLILIAYQLYTNNFMNDAATSVLNMAQSIAVGMPIAADAVSFSPATAPLNPTGSPRPPNIFTCMAFILSMLLDLLRGAFAEILARETIYHLYYSYTSSASIYKPFAIHVALS